jgi:pimeloyl-ACP methyl ester carboxylesterase
MSTADTTSLAEPTQTGRALAAATWPGKLTPWTWPGFGRNVWTDAIEYGVDFAQRTILFWDVMRQRGNQYHEQQEQLAPNVLNFGHELVMDGRALPRPVNYGLVRIVPPQGVELDPKNRPFVIVDPRAGHGPGIGGFKADSEIGVALRAGHTCYFIGFLPEPVAGQTIEDVARAEAAFLERVIELHPEADGKPTVIGNCQAGWAVMMLAAARPELFGPILIAGSPLSYWDGVHGKNPMRYTGGLTGGSWMAALASDLGNGTFDGGWLVENFENLNPANTIWTKQYNVFSKIDTEVQRYLEFEKYWDAHVRLTGAEMQFIVDNLFVGNKLASGDIVTSDGIRIDLRAIRSPIIVFCSRGDNITPPQQALGWILDLYSSVDDIRRNGQTIVYAIHDSVGHLGIFVSGGVARKEHDEFASNIDLIDLLPPGLYEAVLHQKTPGDPHADLAHGDYIARFEPRTLDHIRALGGNDDADDRCFATVARVSEVNSGIYRTFFSPWIRACTNELSADALQRLHPLRVQYELLSDENPLMSPIAATAEAVRRARRPAASENMFLAWQESVSKAAVENLDRWRDLRDAWCERVFFAIYGSPVLQAAIGLSDEPARRKHAVEPRHRAIVEQLIADLKARMAQGGIREAAIRAMIYLMLGEGVADERTFSVVRQLRSEHAADMTLPEFKALVRDQFFMLLVDEQRALATLPELAGRDQAEIPGMVAGLRRAAAAAGELSGQPAARLRKIEALLGVGSTAPEIDMKRIAVGVPPRRPADRRRKERRASTPG